MRILVVGAGATGGAFGTLLQEAGRDVTYLVRPRKQEVLRRDGLRFVSPTADRTNAVQTITAQDGSEAFDLILVTVKAGAFEGVLGELGAFAGPGTSIIPILNGMAHVDRLEQQYPGKVLGGLARIVATLDGDVVRQRVPLTSLMVGGLNGKAVPSDISDALDVPGVEFSVVEDVLGALWEKWVFIAAAGIVNCIFRAPVGRILEAGGESRILEAISETEAVAAAAGHPVSDAGHTQAVGILTEPGSAFTSSLYRDLTAGLPSEAEHILGDLARRARELNVPTPLLDLTLIQIRAGI
ncbi:2-dehydropantoate 2-reductase [Pseudarthrobacter sulfonivorans]|uniref:ketopantoate reductase family protein n=1 Tax=Pseudarthrobacter sulfonivorans TaxID=121292 RepID=UPI0028664D15|nr:2-dehydropantoate 2-reductase [Pseudarthrobacter sulfonivorans]MDR6415596.1 2-dehydropantoate 2-reductase [Pseudarthrobacter sulfonivorans]